MGKRMPRTRRNHLTRALKNIIKHFIVSYSRMRNPKTWKTKTVSELPNKRFPRNGR